MSADTVVRARIDNDTKERATEALRAMGLSVSDAIRLLMLRIADEKRLPFSIQAPNPTTVEAMKELKSSGDTILNCSKPGLASDDTARRRDDPAGCWGFFSLTKRSRWWWQTITISSETVKQIIDKWPILGDDEHSVQKTLIYNAQIILFQTEINACQQ